MRPPTHDDPNAIPRNGTEVPWLESPVAGGPARPRDRRAGDDGAAGGRERRR